MDFLGYFDTVHGENGAIATKTTGNRVYDMFAVGGAYRKRTADEVIALFKAAFDEDATYALRCLFYLRDCRGGQGERRFFRICYHWLCEKYPNIAKSLIEKVAEYGRWDDLIYCTLATPVEPAMVKYVVKVFDLDMESRTPSLLGKWLPSVNASRPQTVAAGRRMAHNFHMTQKQYRQALSTLRSRINIVEKLMSENRWDEIEFDKLPSKAGLIYKNAFARRDIIAQKYEKFAKDENTKVNAAALYPYEVIYRVRKDCRTDVDLAMLEKYWENLPDYLGGAECSMMTVIDTSGSMTGCYNNGSAYAPIDVAISLGMYCAERMGGIFKNKFITFASRPQFITIEGDNLKQKVQGIYRRNLVDNTNLEATFMLILEAAKAGATNIPKTLVVISDMQIDRMTGSMWGRSGSHWTEASAQHEMDKIRMRFKEAGVEMPKLVYWNVDARGDANIIDGGPDVSFVSGCSPVIFKSVLTGKSGMDLMYEVLDSERYASINL